MSPLVLWGSQPPLLPDVVHLTKVSLKENPVLLSAENETSQYKKNMWVETGSHALLVLD